MKKGHYNIKFKIACPCCGTAKNSKVKMEEYESSEVSGKIIDYWWCSECKSQLSVVFLEYRHINQNSYTIRVAACKPICDHE